MAGGGWASAGRVAEAIRRREMSAVEVLAEQLDRIARVDSGLCSVVTLDVRHPGNRTALARRTASGYRRGNRRCHRRIPTSAWSLKPPPTRQTAGIRTADNTNLRQRAQHRSA
jgi:hypothetical protein